MSTVVVGKVTMAECEACVTVIVAVGPEALAGEGAGRGLLAGAGGADGARGGAARVRGARAPYTNAPRPRPLDHAPPSIIIAYFI